MARLVFIGDSLFNNEEICFDEKIINLCKSAEIVIINLEGPITSFSLRDGKTDGFRSKKYAINFLKKLNVSVAILSNNHIMDCGKKGLHDTISKLIEVGIKVVGAGINSDNAFQNITLKTKNRKFVFMSFVHKEFPLIGKNKAGPIPLPDISILKENIYKYKKLGYYIVFCYHGGEERFSVPWPRRRSYFRYLNKIGANFIFGNHSHSIQPFEIINGSPIIYSPGNFYFDVPGERLRKDSDSGLIVDVEIDKRKSILLHRIKADRDDHRIYLMESNYFVIDNDIELDINSYHKKWIKESKEFFKHELKTNPSNNSFFYRNGRKIKRILALFVNLLKEPDISRSIDILFSTFPYVGKMYVKWIDKNGYKNFKY